MIFDPDNEVIKLCAQGMEFEGQARNPEALQLFERAWNEATSDFERFIAAHYVARHQKTIADKLLWDITALNLVLKLNDSNMHGTLPSLYLNVGKCYEDLKDFDNARRNYGLASDFTSSLSDDGYGKMINSGIEAGLARVNGL